MRARTFLQVALGSLSLVLAYAIGARSVEAQAPGGSIGVYADLAGTSTSIVAPAYAPVDFYILARPNVANTNGGLTGAEFRITGSPSPVDAVITPTPNPNSTVSLGNPFDNGGLPPQGCNIAFPACQAPDANGLVLLYTVRIVALNPTSAFLQVEGRDPPTGPNRPFSLVTSCNPPIFTSTEVDGLSATINEVLVTVEGKQWGEVKALYR